MKFQALFNLKGGYTGHDFIQKEIEAGDMEEALKKAFEMQGRLNALVWSISTVESMEHDALDDEEFYNAMQVYRMAPISDQFDVTRKFEAVKTFIRKHFKPVE